VSKLAPFDTWKAPWEEKGEDFNADTAKKYIHGLLSDRESRDGTISSLKAENKTLTTDLAAAKDSSLTAEQRAEKAASDAQERDAKFAKLERENARLRIGQEKGLNAKQMRYLNGETEEELTAAADQILEDFPASATDDKGKGKQPQPQRRQPVEDLRTGAENLQDGEVVDAGTPEAALKLLEGSGDNAWQ